jgi:hypothetical protein
MEDRYASTQAYINLEEVLKVVNNLVEWDLLQIINTVSPLGIKGYQAVLKRNDITHTELD